MATTITHNEAAKRMGVKEWRLRARKGGQWCHYPELGRWQEAAGTTIYLSEEQVQRWIERRDQIFADAEKRIAPIQYQTSTAELDAMRSRGPGWQKTADAIARLGL